MSEVTIIERAYSLARSGKYGSVADLRKQLRREGFSDSQLFGRSLITELGRLCRSASLGLGEPPPPPPKRVRRLLSAEERSEAARRGAATRAKARAVSQAGE